MQVHGALLQRAAEEGTARVSSQPCALVNYGASGLDGEPAM